jgi:flavorubredoxin
MSAVEVKPGVYWGGVNDRTTDLFEGLWPITAEGISYNSYLVKAGQTALINMATPAKEDQLLDRIGDATDPADLDAVIINHVGAGSHGHPSPDRPRWRRSSPAPKPSR